MNSFRGGKHVPDRKEICQNKAIEEMPIVSDYYVNLSQHIGKPAQLCVEIGETVSEGQLIASASGLISANIHSPVGGKIVEVVKRKNSLGVLVDHVHIKPSGNVEVQTMPALECPSQKDIVQRIGDAGIVGMGGAGFPTAVKLQPKEIVDVLVVNAAECEPYLNCDNRLLIERTEDFVLGVRLVAQALGVQKVFIGLEANKPQAYAALMGVDGVVAERQPARDNDIIVKLLAPKYPQGAEKMLIYACTKRKVPTGQLPASVGCVVINVSTCIAVYDAVVKGLPLYKRVMTISGQGIKNPRNMLVRIGTPLSDIVEFCDGLTDNTIKLVSGGPMMGRSLIDTDVATTKTDSGFLALTDEETNGLMPSPCIHCGRCVEVCPMRLSPLYIDFYTKAGDYDTAVKYGALNCFECGSCAYVCPARRPIVQSVRLTKQKIKEKK